MRDWISSISHLATVIGVGVALLTALVGGVAYKVSADMGRDQRVETSINTIAIAVLQAEGNDRTNRLERIERKIDLIGPRLPPPGFWCRGQDCE